MLGNFQSVGNFVVAIWHPESTKEDFDLRIAINWGKGMGGRHSSFVPIHQTAFFTHRDFPFSETNFLDCEIAPAQKFLIDFLQKLIDTRQKKN